MSRRRIEAPSFVAGSLLSAGLSAGVGFGVAATLGPKGRGIYALLVTLPGIIAVMGSPGCHWTAPIAQRRGTLRLGDLRIIAALTLAVGTVEGTILATFLWSTDASRDLSPVAIACVCLGPGFIGLNLVLTQILGADDRWWLLPISTLLQPVLSACMCVATLIAVRGESHTQAGTAVAVAWHSASFLACGSLFLLSRSRAASDPQGRTPTLVWIRESMRAQVGPALQHVAYRTDMLLIGGFGSAAAVGIYGMGVAISELAWLPAHGLGQMVWARGLRASASQPSLGGLLVLPVILTVMATGGALIVAVLFASARPEFQETIWVVAIMAPGIVASSVYRICQSVLLSQAAFSYLRSAGILTACFAVLGYGLASVAATPRAFAGASAMIYIAQAIIGVRAYANWRLRLAAVPSLEAPAPS